MVTGTLLIASYKEKQLSFYIYKSTKSDNYEYARRNAVEIFFFSQDVDFCFTMEGEFSLKGKKHLQFSMLFFPLYSIIIKYSMVKITFKNPATIK